MISLPTVLAALALVAAVIGIYLALTRLPRQTPFATQEPLCRLVLDGDLVREATGTLAPKLARNADIDDVLALFNPDEGHLRQSLQTLIETGSRFDEVAQAADGELVHVIGQPDGILAKVTIHASSPISEALYDIQSQLEVLMQERDRLRRRLTGVPLAMMELDAKGREIWANRQFRALCDQVRSPQELVELMKVPASEPVEVGLPGGETHWLRIVQRPSGDTTLVTAYPADDQMRAERNLSRFMTSLTDTFAHLKVGLAVFDNERRLSLFNPAISEMFNLDPAALIARPGLREFLESLRQKRMVPEMRAFAEWRDRITDLDDSLEGGVFQEDWSLPSGQVLRITGRPHPDGALAFLFEDITSALTLERRYRAEIELGQGTLDALPDAVAVIDTSGAMILANNAFEEMWQVEEIAGLEAPTLNELIEVFRGQTDNEDIWSRLQRFVQSSTDREETWTVAISLKDGSTRYGRFSVLGGGAAMLLFRDHGSRVTDRDSDNTSVELTRVPLTKGAQKQSLLNLDLSAIGLALPAGTGAAQPDWTKALHDRLGAFLAARGLKLQIDAWSLPEVEPSQRDQLRRLLWCLGVSAAGIAPPKVTLTLRAGVQNEALTLTLAVPGGDASLPGNGQVLSQMIEDIGGTFTVGTLSDVTNVTGTLPLHLDGTDKGPVRSVL